MKRYRMCRSSCSEQRTISFMPPVVRLIALRYHRSWDARLVRIGFGPFPCDRIRGDGFGSSASGVGVGTPGGRAFWTGSPEVHRFSTSRSKRSLLGITLQSVRSAPVCPPGCILHVQDLRAAGVRCCCPFLCADRRTGGQWLTWTCLASGLHRSMKRSCCGTSATRLTTRRGSLFAYVNVNAINLACDLPWFRDFLNSAECAYCDGEGVRFGAGILGRIPSRPHCAHVFLLGHLRRGCAATITASFSSARTIIFWPRLSHASGRGFPASGSQERTTATSRSPAAHQRTSSPASTLRSPTCSSSVSACRCRRNGSGGIVLR